LIDRFLQVQKAAQRSRDISIHNRRGLVEGKAYDRTGRVSSDPRQLQQFIFRRGKVSVQLPHDDLRAPVKISGSVVIPKPLPGEKNFGFAGVRQVANRWESLKPAPVVGQDGCHLRLLEHEFRDKDCIRIRSFAPGQLAALTLKPGDQGCAKLRAFNEVLLHPFAPVNSYTIAITPLQAEALRTLLKGQGFEFSDRPYTIFFAQKAKLSIAVYEKGPKVVVQGKDTEDFVRFYLEPEILKEARIGYEEVLQPEMFEPHFGIDESGKGDFFGPLVIAGVYVEREIARHLLSLGVIDSKRIGSDKRIGQLADGILRTPGLAANIVLIGPEKYNSLYEKFANLNDLLAWGHARVIENLLMQKPDCKRSLSDKFANERVIQNALLKQGRQIQIDQRTKAESDIAVAAASILARNKFVRWLDTRGAQLGIALPKGVSGPVKSAARAVVGKVGRDALRTLAKMHFRTSAEVLDENANEART
jgi:ribonuclease HIII